MLTDIRGASLFVGAIISQVESNINAAQAGQIKKEGE